MDEETAGDRNIWVSMEIGHNTIYRVSFNDRIAPFMALRSLVHMHEYHEFQVNEEERLKIIEFSQNKKWTELYNYLVKKGFILKTFSR